MKSALLSICFIFVAAVAGAETKEPCTTDAKDKWQDEKAFQENLKGQGYKIKKFKVTKNSCYEIYGWDKAGKRVEIYFNPVSGSVVKENIEK
jgi:hypothetical protein